MARKKQTKVEEVSRLELSNGTVIVKFEDGTMQIIPAPISLSAEEAEQLIGTEEVDEEEDDEEEEEKPAKKGKKTKVEEPEEDDEEEDDEDSEDEDDEEEDEEGDDLTPEQLSEMDFEELEELCEDNDLDTDPDNYDEDDVEKFRKAIAKELGMTLPSSKKKKK